MENEKILQELQEIKELLKQLLEAQIQTNDNLVEVGEEVSDTLSTIKIIMP